MYNRDQESIITQKVKRFYEKIQFPGRRPLEQDSLIFLRRFSRLTELLSRNYPVIRVLDAGCGTGNTALELARQFKNIQVLAVDISAASIKTAEKSARINKISNIRFQEHNLLDKFDDRQKFNIILCFGVLHHTAAMQKVLNNFYACLVPGGKMFLWVYGKYGRYRHMLNVELLSMLISVHQDSIDPVDLARDFIFKTQDGNILRDLLGDRSDDPLLRPFYDDPTWIADQFLNPNEYFLTMKDLLGLTGDSGFKIAEWIGAPADFSGVLNSPLLKERNLIFLSLSLSLIKLISSPTSMILPKKASPFRTCPHV